MCIYKLFISVKVKKFLQINLEKFKNEKENQTKRQRLLGKVRKFFQKLK